MYSDVYGNGFRRIIQKPIIGECLNKKCINQDFEKIAKKNLENVKLSELH